MRGLEIETRRQRRHFGQRLKGAFGAGPHKLQIGSIIKGFTMRPNLGQTPCQPSCKAFRKASPGSR
jgi:hypothetical protein